jgi:predicted transcriptional regulator
VTFTEDLRQKLKKKIGVCPCCGQNTMTIRASAKKIGIPTANLYRFVSGRQPSAETIDAVVKWLAK